MTKETIQCVSTTIDRPALRLEICTAQEHLQSRWEDVRRLEGYCRNVFLTADWLSTWVDVFVGPFDLHFVFALDEFGAVQGCAPCVRRERRLLGLRTTYLELAGTGTSVTPEYLEIVCAPKFRLPFVSALADYFQSHPDLFDVICLDRIAADSPSNQQFHAAFADFGTVLKDIDRCPFFLLPESFEVFLEQKSYNMRRTVRRVVKRLESKYRVEVEYITNAGDIDRALSTARTLHEQSRSVKAQKGNFGKPGYMTFHRTLAHKLIASGQLVLAFIKFDGRPVAFRYGFLHLGRYYDYQTGYDPIYEQDRPGFAMLVYLVRDLIGRSVQEFDFLSGAHEYKYHWATGERTVSRLTLYERGFVGHACQLRDRAKHGLQKWLLRPIGSVINGI